MLHLLSARKPGWQTIHNQQNYTIVRDVSHYVQLCICIVYIYSFAPHSCWYPSICFAGLTNWKLKLWTMLSHTIKSIALSEHILHLWCNHELLVQMHSVWSWWRHQMETFSALLALFAGNSPVPVNSLHKDQWRGALMFSLFCAWINDWVNNREAGDFKCHRAHHAVNVMWPLWAASQMHCKWRIVYVVIYIVVGVSIDIYTRH